jgi:hypothetical protein
MIIVILFVFVIIIIIVVVVVIVTIVIIIIAFFLVRGLRLTQRSLRNRTYLKDGKDRAALVEQGCYKMGGRGLRLMA